MYKTVSEAEKLAAEIVEGTRKCGHKIMMAPPFTALSAVKKIIRGTDILLGAQNMAMETEGAHTGEVSVLMLKEIGVDVVILGHSERRVIYGEKDATINRKVRLALENAMDVILCVGETLPERETGKAEEIVRGQITACLGDVGEASLSRITIAYEPVWAIGTGKNATPADADSMHGVIRNLLSSLYSEKSAKSIVIQYGGSVKPENAGDLLNMPEIDGALVGGASLKAATFLPIIDAVVFLKN